MFQGLSTVVLILVLNYRKQGKRMKLNKDLAASDHDGMEEFMKIQENLDAKLNIMIVGPAGVGKSTLINKLFGIDGAKVGVGKPVTTKISAFKKGNLTIYDTAGIEMNEEKRGNYLKECISLINEKQKQGEDEQIHLLMYCVQPPRLQTVEEEYLASLSKCSCFGKSQLSIPVLIVNPRPYNADEDSTKKFYNEEVVPRFKKLFPFNGDYTIYEVQAIEYKQRGQTFQAFGLEALEQAMVAKVGEARRIALVRALRESVDLKCEEAKKIANKYIAYASTTAIGSTITGIPDSVALLGFEIAMCAHMGTIFDFALDKNRVQAIVEASIETVAVATLASFAGHWLMTIATAGGSLVIEAVGRTAIAAATVKSLSVSFIGIMRKYALGELDDEQATMLLVDKLRKAHSK